MKNYNALIVDDELGNRELLSTMLLKHCPKITQVALAGSVKEAKAQLQKTHFDVVFLDIEMPLENGFELLNQLKEVNFKVIFVTAYDAYALRAIKYSALDYLLKPVDVDELKAAVEKLASIPDQRAQLDLLSHNLQDGNERRVALATQDEVLFVELGSIVRLEAQANYTRVFLLESSPVMLSGNLGHYEKTFNDKRFYRTHQSHLINLHHLKKYVKTEGGYFVMVDDSHVPISRLKKDEVKALLA
jgi:two-component system LytT family response regulator